MPTLRLPVGASSVRADVRFSAAVAVAPATTSAAAKISHLRIAMCPCLLASASDGEVSWGPLASPTALTVAKRPHRPLSSPCDQGRRLVPLTECSLHLAGGRGILCRRPVTYNPAIAGLCCPLGA